MTKMCSVKHFLDLPIRSHSAFCHVWSNRFVYPVRPSSPNPPHVTNGISRFYYLTSRCADCDATVVVNGERQTLVRQKIRLASCKISLRRWIILAFSSKIIHSACLSLSPSYQLLLTSVSFSSDLRVWIERRLFHLMHITPWHVQQQGHHFVVCSINLFLVACCLSRRTFDHLLLPGCEPNLIIDWTVSFIYDFFHR